MTSRRRRTRSSYHGGLFIEILGAFTLAVIVLVPLLGGFTTGVRQTRTAKSYVAAHSVGTWAVAQAKTLVEHGLADTEAAVDLTADALGQIPGPSRQLMDLRVHRSMAAMGSAGRCYSIGVTVSWVDAQIKRRRTRTFQAIARSEI